MSTKLPVTEDEILATGKIDPIFAEVLAENPIPSGSEYTIEALKALSKGTLPRLQATLASSRPSTIEETEIYIPMLRDDYEARSLICCPKTLTGKTEVGPTIILFHGGGHCIGTPESELVTARGLVQRYKATVILPSYRLAPENPFPASINDAWDIVQVVASQIRNKSPSFLPHHLSADKGFIVGGTSAGANLASVIAHLARDNHLEPPITGQFLIAGTYISPFSVPPEYQPRYLSRQQNQDAPILDRHLGKIFLDSFKPDYQSPLYASFNQHNPDDFEGEIKQGHLNLPLAYFQVCGMDMSRDDGLIYESVLRKECGVPTKIDLYPGYPHCWWQLPMFAELEMSRKRNQDLVEGIGWLIEGGEK